MTYDVDDVAQSDTRGYYVVPAGNGPDVLDNRRSSPPLSCRGIPELPRSTELDPSRQYMWIQ